MVEENFANNGNFTQAWNAEVGIGELLRPV
jgi:hypothetical protein